MKDDRASVPEYVAAHCAQLAEAAQRAGESTVAVLLRLAAAEAKRLAREQRLQVRPYQASGGEGDLGG